MNLSLASIHIHPIKSLGGFEVAGSKLTDRGLEHDRRWMLVDENGTFVTQREIPAMACLHTSPGKDGFQVTDIRNGSSIALPWRMDGIARMRVQVWSNSLSALHSGEMDEWFSTTLDRKLKLVYMPDGSKRRTDGRYAIGLNSFSDSLPYSIVSAASLDDLNARLLESREANVPMDRFRPNLVIAGGAAYQEDAWKIIQIGRIQFDLVKACARCMIITTDQQNATRGPEPLRTLSTYRRKGNKVMFAMNAVSSMQGTITKGDPVVVTELR